MPDITVSQPCLGLEAYFTFKEPISGFVKNKLNTSESSVLLKIIGINNLKSLIELELRDPYADAYNPMGISVADYKRDVLNAVPLYLFEHRAPSGKITYLKVPLNYLLSYSQVSDIVYTNQLLVMDLGKLPKDLDITGAFTDLSDFVFNRFGVRPETKQVSVGNPETLTRDEHTLRESIRLQSTTVTKSNTTLLAEISHKYNQITARLAALNISLG